MEQPPYMPPPPKRFPWLIVVLTVIGTVVILGVVGAMAGLTAKPKAAPPVIVIQSPSPAPSPVPLPEPDPVIVDPMDDAIIELHGVVYVQQFCNMVDRSGIDDFAQLIDIGKPWRTNSIGSAWVAAQNRTGYPISKLATEFYSRYC
jgi:hypothetical protein